MLMSMGTKALDIEGEELSPGSNLIVSLSVYRFDKELAQKHEITQLARALDANVSGAFSVLRYGIGLGLVSFGNTAEEDYSVRGVDLQFEIGPSISIAGRLSIDCMLGVSSIIVGRDHQNCEQCIGDSFVIPADFYVKPRIAIFPNPLKPGLGLEYTRAVSGEREFNRYSLSAVYQF